MAEGYSSSDDDDPPKDPELKIEVGNVLNQLKVGADNGFSLDKWHFLGMALKLPESKLKVIEMNHNMDVERCLIEVIKCWIYSGKVQWKVLWEALYHSTVAHENLGKEIKDWYKEKIWSDPRRGHKSPRRTYIQMPDRDKRLKAVEHEFCDTGFSPPADPEQNPPKYFRPVPVRAISDQSYTVIIVANSITRLQDNHTHDREGHLDNMKPALTNYFFKLIEPHQKKFKAGYEARFGQLYWKNIPREERQGNVQDFTYKLTDRRFSTHITCDITSLTTAKCHPPNKDHEAWLIDPLKFEVDLPQYKDDVFVAVISDLRENGFRLHDVYQWQKKPLNTSFDFVHPRRKYDFRIADCCALLTKMDDVKVRQIADEITRSIHRGLNETLSMQLVGKDFHVRFFRQKRQWIYQWKNKEKEKWYLAEYDVDTFEMSKAKLETYRQKISGDDKPHRWPIEFNGGHRKEIELWNRKIFPERYSSSHPTAKLYIDPEATGELRMPLAQEKPATTWTTEELMKDLDEFVQAACEITDFLERAPELRAMKQ